MNYSTEIKGIITLKLNRDLAEYIYQLLLREQQALALKYWRKICPIYRHPVDILYTKNRYLLEHIRSMEGCMTKVNEEIVEIRYIREQNRLWAEAWNKSSFLKYLNSI